MYEEYEKLGLFYLGQSLDDNHLTLYKSRNLTTHAAIIGMTGSGKTGLGIGLIEEAAIDNIPSIVIDPKGDMGNLCLTFPDLKPENFKPWIDPIDASNRGESIDEAAASTAKLWRNGLSKQHQSLSRIKKLHNVDITIYTPGSSAGVGVNILGKFGAPSREILDDADTFAALINTTVSSLLSLVSIKSDALRSKEFLLLSTIFSHFWRKGEGLSLETLVGQIASPPFKKIGVLNLGDFYPQNKRMELAMLFNNVLSSVGFSSWIEGEPLDIQDLLYDEQGNARVAIFSIAHLSDAQRMFFVTLLLNRFLGWMRTQRGSSTLRALLYMDEIYGYFPPSRNPPSKTPMMILLKQARAFGIGIILSTQNPVDIDYKGLSNIGTWFIGKLQTRQDISRVIDGLAGKMENIDRSEIIKMISNLKGRTFFLKSAHENEVKLFSTRWVLSYLKGPLSKEDIRTLMAGKKTVSSVSRQQNRQTRTEKKGGSKPVLSDAIEQLFYDTDISGDTPFQPYFAVSAQIRYFNQKRGIDKIEKIECKVPIEENDTNVRWQQLQNLEIPFSDLAVNAQSGASFAPLPGFVTSEKKLTGIERSLKNYLYTHKRIKLFRCPKLKIESAPQELERDFSITVEQMIREKKEEALEKLAKRFKTKSSALQKRYQRALARVEKEESDVTAKTTDTAISIGMAIFGAIFGSKNSAVSRGSRALRGGKGIMKERADVARAQEALGLIEEEMQKLEEEFEFDSRQLGTRFLPEAYPIEAFYIKPRRTDVTIDRIALLWER